jgi:hypothetical protein
MDLKSDKLLDRIELCGLNGSEWLFHRYSYFRKRFDFLARMHRAASDLYWCILSHSNVLASLLQVPVSLL